MMHTLNTTEPKIKIRENIIKNNILMKDGYIKTNILPGLGIDVDENYLNEIKFKDEFWTT